MRSIGRSTALAAFRKYVGAFIGNDERIAIKVSHTMRVAALCEKIASGGGMFEEDADLAWLCGMLHDIGRFEQLRIWGTFKDSASCSHAELGLAVLDGEHTFAGRKLSGSDGRLCLFSDDDEVASVVRPSVTLHSALRLPEGLDPRIQRFCDIVRDADKIDIIRVFSESDVRDVLGLTSEEFACGEISDAAMVAFRERRCLGPGDRKTKLDGLVGVVCLPFEIVSSFAREELARLNYLQRLLERPFGLGPVFSLPDTRAKYEEISKALL